MGREYFTDGLRVSPAVWVMIEAALLPILLFLIAFSLIPKNKSLLQRVFESTLYVVMGALLQVIIVQLFDYLSNAFRGMTNVLPPPLIPMIITTSLIILMYISALMCLKRSKLLNTGISSKLQKIYILLFLGAFLAHAGTTVYRMAQQYPSNPNLSGFFSTTVEYLALPVVLFSFAYLLCSTRLLKISRVFQGALFTTMGMMLLLVAQGVLRYQNLNVIESIFKVWGHIFYSLMLVALVLAIYIGAVLYYRKLQRV